jgi:hypothetical protein
MAHAVGGGAGDLAPLRDGPCRGYTAWRMPDTLRPHVVLAAGPIRDVVPIADGGFALLTTAGVELRDAELRLRATIAGDPQAYRLTAGPGERWLIHSWGLSRLAEAVVGGAITPVDLGDGLMRDLVVTESGFLALTGEGVVVDQGGARMIVAVKGRLAHGGSPWRGGAIVGGHDGLAIVDELGDVVASSSGVALWERPVALADAIAAPTRDDDVAVFDARARLVARIARKAGREALTAFGSGVLVRTHDDEGGSEVSWWDVCGARATLGWSFAAEDMLQAPVVVGERVVLATYEGMAWIVDRDGEELAELDLPGKARHIAAFAGGVAIAVDDSPDVLWWREGEALTRLPHDVGARALVTAPAGVVTVEDEALYLWRPDAPGPAPTKITADVPLQTPLVIGGHRVVVEAEGRFVMRARSEYGIFGLRRGATWRPAATREQAEQIVARLLSRQFPGPLPAVPTDGTFDATTRHLGQLPLAETVDLHGVGMFAAAKLEPAVRARVCHARELFLAELAAALGTTPRMLRAAIRARKSALAPPQPVPGYEYLGSFTSAGELTVGDPCYIGRKVHPAMGFALSVKVTGHPGVWHVFVRSATGTDRGRTAELAVVHESGFGVYADQPVASFGVDSGTAGVFDRTCPKPDLDMPVEEGVVSGLGALARSGYGDGFYPVFAGRHGGKAAKLRLVFIADEPDVDRLIGVVDVAAAKRYAASARFELGDTIEHVKFGVGAVVRVDADGKIDVRFADETRTLVHARG